VITAIMAVAILVGVVSIVAAVTALASSRRDDER
jgi:hypothetical protein